jgi:hypothetical protein
MDIRFRTGKEPVVKFTQGEKKALLTVLETLECYACRIGLSPDGHSLIDTREELIGAAKSIGLKDREKSDE